MPTYEYQCTACGHRVTYRQTMSEIPLRKCPECGGELKRLITGGTGFVMKTAGGQGRSECRLEREGTTCCGRSERCGRPRCEE